ncbi:Uncharacterized protein TPAR_06250 [Tolypocladium paradoxum]|uniref:Zn(2)-C6 fungal-type domain-containing protein n=1 Tax=Tolypocladium paradoxum TaxID=94208 RepID=A0A2S4KTR0_9HYPO|nr:Uncharacterized protein TPAR_06250 [Tolypocladium paradoxum]
MAASSSQSTLPQGFSVYQPALGAQLQFFPALGSQQLDDLINAYVPGPAAISEKRASVSVDFLEYAQLTGQTFKFYPVYAAASVAASPVAASPSLDSANSSFNVSPVTSSWDWSAAASVSSRSSTQRRRHSKATTPSSRHQTATDFSSMPGMKILTKDGVDVTNSASRGSKTKEQRDHAHLMRIIKACDNCRRKKIRCDPSHKKRVAAQASAQTAATGVVAPKPSKKQRTLPQAQPPPPQTQCSAPPAAMVVDELAPISASSDLDSSFDFSALESLDPTAVPCDPWEEFVQFPPMDITEDYDFFLDPENYFSQSSASSSSASPFKALTPQSQQEVGAPPGADNLGGDEMLQARSPRYPFLDQPGSSGSDYADFNLFSPESSFSEDDRMLPIGSSSSSLPSLNEPLISDCPPAGYDVRGGGDGDVGGWDDAVASAEALRFSAGDDVGRIDYYDPGLQGRESSNRLSSSGLEPPVAAESLGGQVVICCAPATVVLAPDGSSSHILDNASTTLDVSGSGLARPAASVRVPAMIMYAARRLTWKKEPPAHLDSQPGRIATTVGHRNVRVPAAVSHATRRLTCQKEFPAALAVQDYVATTATSAHGHNQSSVNVLHTQGLCARLSSRRSEAESYGTESVLQGLYTGRERVTGSHVTPAGPERATVSHIAPTRESFVEPSVAESPGQPSTSRGAEAGSISLASPRVLHATSVDRLVDSVVSHVAAGSPDHNRSATQQHVDMTVPLAVSSAGEDAVDLHGLLGVSSATSRPSHASGQWPSRAASVNGSSLGSRLSVAAIGQQIDAAQISSKSAPGERVLAFVAATILSAFVLYMHSELTSASTSAYMLGALLVFASKATASAPTIPTLASATVSRKTKQQSSSIKGNSSQFSEATSSILDRPGRTLAAVRSRVSQFISQGSARALPVMTLLKG